MINRLINFIKRGILAGVCIGIAGICFLRGGKLVGAALFAFGLAAVIQSKWALFTGACGFADYRKISSWPNIFFMLGCNAIGVILACILGAGEDTAKVAHEVVAIRFGMSPLKLLGGSILCGFIMTVSVMHARKGSWIPLLLGIPTFVICGFPHCVADICYYYQSGEWGWPWIMTIIGNFIGCNIPTLTDKERQPQTIC